MSDILYSNHDYTYKWKYYDITDNKNLSKLNCTTKIWFRDVLTSYKKEWKTAKIITFKNYT